MNNAVLSKSKPDIYSSVTTKIIAAIEAGTNGYVMPWHGAGTPAYLPRNAATKARYQGVNIIALWIDASIKGFGSGYWASYKQWQSLGAQVRRGEHGSVIVFFKPRENTQAEDLDEKDKRPRFVARASRVFNSDQVDGWEVPRQSLAPTVETRDELDVFVEATGARIRHGGVLARYLRNEDRIEMPDLNRFRDTATSTATEGYYAVLLHELTHWSGAKHRLNREFGKRFGDKAYAFEELVAELGAAFLCANLNVVNEPRRDHACYLSSWLKILGNDRKAIFTSASRAQEATDYLTGLAAKNIQHRLQEAYRTAPT